MDQISLVSIGLKSTEKILQSFEILPKHKV